MEKDRTFSETYSFLENATLSVEAKAILMLLKVWPETEKKDGHCTARQIQYYLHMSETRYRKHLTFLESEGYVEALSTRCLGQKRTEIVTLKEITDTAETAPAGLWDVVANPDYPITAKVVYAYLALSAVDGKGEFPLGKLLVDFGFSANTARRYLRYLAEASLIEVSHADEERRQSPWAFTILART